MSTTGEALKDSGEVFKKDVLKDKFYKSTWLQVLEDK